MGDKLSDVDVSLEPQLAELLIQVSKLLPQSLGSRVSTCLSSAPVEYKTTTVPYALLLDISRWTRTDEGAHALREHKPPLYPASFSMVSLLAGTRTSPNRIFPSAPLPPRDAKREITDRRAVVAVMNALVSIVGAGAAAWYTAQSVGWRDEWKVILALLVSAAVAIAEVGLYLIWESRTNTTKKAERVVRAPQRTKLDEPPANLLLEHTAASTFTGRDNKPVSDSTLRQRSAAASSSSQ